MRHLARTLSCALVVIAVFGVAASSARASAIRSGFDATSYGGNDDGTYPCASLTFCSPTAISLPFSLDFYGATYSNLFLNNNGNVTFGEPLSTYTPEALQSLNIPILAPFWADVDTRAGNTVSFGTGTVDGHDAWGANWPLVGCYDDIISHLNAFQIVVIDRSDIGSGDFDVEFNYAQVQWEAGEVSGGM